LQHLFPIILAVKLLLRFHRQDDREQVLQRLAGHLFLPAGWIPELVAVFRAHAPQITLPTEATTVLPRLRTKYRLGCVTNGRAIVQHKKLHALQVKTFFDAIVVADELGREYWKPHPLPLQRCCELLQVTPADAVFVGDSLSLDLAGARSAGLSFVWMRRPGNLNGNTERPPPPSEVEGEVRDLYELERWLSVGVVAPNLAINT